MPRVLSAGLVLLLAVAASAAGCTDGDGDARCSGDKCDQPYSADAGLPDGSPLDAAPSVDPAIVEACGAMCDKTELCASDEDPTCVDSCVTQGSACDAEAAAELASCVDMPCDAFGLCVFDVFETLPCFSVCGDQFCQASEDCESCPEDCGATCEGTCGHDVCAEGAGLDPSCSPCAEMVCAAAPSCCDVVWFSHTCFPLANELCGAECEIPPDR